ncbi:MAG TPA: heat-inducible transcriptional repressor HrcA [Armatimonadota bacterium]|nr:heat-inducible transcriptional repressor HrcA [Armatimonadota bacterium]
MRGATVARTLDERKRAILGVVVERYIATGEPVGSAWVVGCGDLAVCSATVRNEMSELERAGYLGHPHTSAGRVPTDRGYRVYAESVVSRAQPGADPGPFADLECSQEAETALEATCRALARLTRFLSLAQPPSWRHEKLRYLQLSRLNPRRVLVVVVTETGRVHHALLEFNRLPSTGQLRALGAVISDRLRGVALVELDRDRLLRAVRELWSRTPFADQAVELLSASLPVTAGSPLVIEGGSRLLETQEFQQAEVAREVFGVIEERSYLSELLARQRPGVSVMIGDDTGHPALRHCALVSATYQAPGGACGCLGVLGPKRMPYGSVMSALLLAARALGAAFASKARK